jgi:hypothetical protein
MAGAADAPCERTGPVVEELGEPQALSRPGTCRRIDEMRGAPSPEHLGPSFG